MRVGDEEGLQPGAFVGRDAEVGAALRVLSRTTRLLTLTGPPGVGKTRLATEVTERLRGEYADGVVFVDLSSARDAVTALSELARRIGVELAPAAGPRRVVHDWLHGKHILLFLDNAEQVSGLADEITGLLEQSPRIRILVTSREHLRLSIEHVISVPPLAMPASSSGLQGLDVARLSTTPSVQMFAAEARAVQPDFEVTAENAAAVAEVCVRVDGLPLAIKLAAVRVKLLSPADIAARLSATRALLETSERDIPARHRTLHSAISWSYHLLDDGEQAAFRRLSIFSSPWTFVAAEAVLDQHEGLLETLSSLLDKSLIQRLTAEKTTRFSMLESLREYAAEELDLRSERSAVADRHTRHFAQIAVSAEAVIGTASEAHWWDSMTWHERDIRTALEWADETDDLESSAVLAAALGWYRYLRGHVGAGTDIVDYTLARAAAATTAAPSARASVPLLASGGILAWASGDLDRADDLLSRAALQAPTIGDYRHEAIATAFLAQVARDQGQLDVARTRHQRAGQLFDELDNPRGAAWARYDLGRTEWQAGELERAADLLRETLTQFRRNDYHWAAAWTAWALGSIRLIQHDVDNGVALILDGMDAFEAASDRRGVANCLESLAVSAAAQERYPESLQLLSAADQLRTRLLAPLTESEASALKPSEQASVEALGEYGSESAREEGRAMPIPAVLALAHHVGTELQQKSQARNKADVDQVLTSREREVGELVASGCTNQQIGSSLGITARTAEAHVRNIMGKLDARSRSEVAVWMVTHR